MRGIPSFPDKLTADVEGDIEEIDRILVITRIRVKYRLKVPKDKRAAAERALATHEDKCPAATSVKRGIALEWKADIEEI
ncbi:MAG: OsmC family protein [Vicinamibacteria bacterium]